MAVTLNRTNTKAPLEERLLQFAARARSAALLITPGREQDELLKKARQAESLASVKRDPQQFRDRPTKPRRISRRRVA